MKYKLICFDLDGTLIDDIEYIWKFLHDEFKVPLFLRKQHHESYLKGNITYSEWFESDIFEWKKRNIKKHQIVKAIKKIKVMRGAKETIKKLRLKGYKIAVISGSLSIVLETLLPDIKFDDVLINKITFSEKTGEILAGTPTPYDMEHKASGLIKLAAKESINLKECVFVGDNENDVHIASIAGFSIAFNSKSENLNKVSDVILEVKNLKDILLYL